MQKNLDGSRVLHDAGDGGHTEVPYVVLPTKDNKKNNNDNPACHYAQILNGP